MQRVGRYLQSAARKYVPDPFLLAWALTVVVFLFASLSVGWSNAANGWLQGFSSTGFLGFALQICLVLLTGHVLATTPLIERAVRSLATIPKTTRSATLLITLISCAAAAIHWGLGTIVGAFLAREIYLAKGRQLKLHYPVLGAAAYCGFAVWHGGLSGSAPLKVAESGHFASELIGVVPVSKTLFSALNITTMIAVSFSMAFSLMWIAPKYAREEYDLAARKPVSYTPPANAPCIEQLYYSRILSIGIAGFGFLLFILFGLRGELQLNLNTLNAAFLFLGIALQPSLGAYAERAREGATSLGPVVLQFPLYAGILGLMKSGGFVREISAALSHFGNEVTFPIIAFLSAGFVNFAVPSGGGQWAIQGEVLLEAGKNLGVAPEITILAFAYGDAWTNLLQPFWALPLLGIMGLKARDIMGYTAFAALINLAVVIICLLAFS